MQTLGTPEDVRLALGVLRLLRGWTQAEMAAAAGVHKSLLSLYEQGKTVPTAKTLGRLIAAVELPPASFDSVVGLVRLIRYWSGRSDEASADAAAALARIVGTTVEVAVARDLAGWTPDDPVPPRQADADDTAELDDLWESLESLSVERRSLLVREIPDFQNPRLSERLCAESERAAPADAVRAQELAALASEIAERTVAPAEERARLRSHAEACLAEARRG
jgi:transcriptional regulator with XRE-family HTH domain